MMGKPNQPYARSVPLEESAALAADLPNVGDVFDRLLKRSKTEDWDSVSFFLLFIYIFHIVSNKFNS
jgi:hypothetical protein